MSSFFCLGASRFVLSVVEHVHDAHLGLDRRQNKFGRLLLSLIVFAQPGQLLFLANLFPQLVCLLFEHVELLPGIVLLGVDDILDPPPPDTLVKILTPVPGPG